MSTLVSTYRDIAHIRFNSAFLRKILGLVYREGKLYTIPFGPFRGIKLRYDPSINFHAMLGLWELDGLRFLKPILLQKDLIPEGATLCDIGANIGLYSAWLSTVLPTAKIHAIEPAPYAKNRLHELIKLNNIKNVEIHDLAFADRMGEIAFFIGAHHHQSSLNEEWAGDGKVVPTRIQVRSTTIDDFFLGTDNRELPSFIKMDIEGGGTFALKGCHEVLKRKRPFLFIESHTPNEDRAISDFVVKYDYEAFRVHPRKLVTLRSEVHPNKNGIWGNLFLAPSEYKRQISKLIRL